MKLETPFLNTNPEQSPVQIDHSVENKFELPPLEMVAGVDIERKEQTGEAMAIVSDVVLSSTASGSSLTDESDDKNTTIGDFPITANDDDLIEKEWVDKAKKIVEDTMNNPHQREKAVSDLQVDYLKKRYGRDLGITK